MIEFMEKLVHIHKEKKKIKTLYSYFERYLEDKIIPIKALYELISLMEKYYSVNTPNISGEFISANSGIKMIIESDTKPNCTKLVIYVPSGSKNIYINYYDVVYTGVHKTITKHMEFKFREYISKYNLANTVIGTNVEDVSDSIVELLCVSSFTVLEKIKTKVK